MNTNNFLRWLCTTVAFAAVFQAAAQTSVINGGFENTSSGTTPDSWNAVGSQPPTLSTDSHSGTYSVDLAVTNTADTANNSEIQQNTYNAGGGMVNEGEVYTLSFWAKQISSGVSYVQNYKVSWLNNIGAPVSDGTGFIPFTGGNGTWTQITKTNITAPAGAVAAFIQIFGATGAVTNGFGEVLIDELTLSTNGASSGGGGSGNGVQASIASGSQVSWNSTSGASDQVQRASSAGGPWSNLGSSIAGVSGTSSIFDLATGYFYRVIETTSGGGGGNNALSNGGFETAGANPTNAAGWSVTQAVGSPALWYGRTNGLARSGSYAFAIHLAANPGQGPVVRLEATGVPVTGGTTYPFTFFANQLTGSAGAAPQWVIQWVGPGGVIGDTGFRSYTPGNNAYASISNSVTAAANATSANIVFYTPGAADTTQSATILFDDVTLGSGGGGGTGTTNTLTTTVQSGVQVSWSSGAGTNYLVQSSATVSESGTPWSNFGSAIPGDGTTKSVFDTATGTSKFYQVLAQ